jgi:hypothetical protein
VDDSKFFIMPTVFNIDDDADNIGDDAEDQIEATPDWHLPIIKERLAKIDDALFADATEFIQSLK